MNRIRSGLVGGALAVLCMGFLVEAGSLALQFDDADEVVAAYKLLTELEANAQRLVDPVVWAEGRLRGVRLWGFHPWPTGFDEYDPAWSDSEDWRLRNTHPDYRHGSGQVRVLVEIRDHRRVVVISASDVGKTFLGGNVVIPWWMTRPESMLLGTSGTWAQLQDQLWSEYRLAHQHFGFEGEPTAKGLDLPDERMIRLRSTNKQSHFTGYHERNVMVLVDEGHAAPPWLFKTIERAISDHPHAKIVVFGNPIEAQGPYFALTKTKGWRVVNLSQLDYVRWVEAGNEPIPAVVHPDEPRRKITDLGMDDPGVQTYVLGQFPKPGPGSILFSPFMLHQAFERRCDPEGELEVGIDVARLGGDRTVGYWRRGHVLRKWLDIGPSDPQVRDLPAGDRARYLEWLTNLVDIELRKLPVHPKVVRIDYDGPGQGLGDNLAAMGWPVCEVHFGALPASLADQGLYEHQKALGYWRFSDALPQLDVEQDDDLLEQLPAHRPTYVAARRDKTKKGVKSVTKKDDVVAEVGHSPDHADGAMLCFLPDLGYQDTDYSALDAQWAALGGIG